MNKYIYLGLSFKCERINPDPSWSILIEPDSGVSLCADEVASLAVQSLSDALKLQY